MECVHAENIFSVLKILLFLSMQLILIKDDPCFSFTSIYVTGRDPTFLMGILGVFPLEGGYLTETREILGRLSGLYFVLRRFRVTISCGRNLSKMSDSGEGVIIYFLTSVPQCHLEVFCW